MKRIFGVVIGLGIVGGLGYLALTQGSVITVNNESREVATSTSAVAPAEPTPAELMEMATKKLIEEAIVASSEEIESAKTKAANDVEHQMELEIERKVRAELGSSNDARMTEIDKETGQY